MIGRRVFFILASALFFNAFIQASANEDEGSLKLAVTVTAEITVSNPEKSGRELIDFCEASGGYYTRKTDLSVYLRCPAGLQDTIQQLLKKSGTIIRYSINTADTGTDYLVLDRQLKSREKLLNEYKQLLDSSGFAGTLSLERELMKLVSEIEEIKGRLLKMENEYRFMKLEVNYFSMDYGRPERGESVFDWINRIDFYSFYDAGGRYHAE